MFTGKKVPLLIVASGLMLGVVFSVANTSTSSKKSSPAISPEPPMKAKSAIVSNLTLKSSKDRIEATSMEADYINNQEQVDKTELTVMYSNSSTHDIKDAQILLDVKPQVQIGSYDTDTTKYNPEESKGGKTLVFDIPIIKAGSQGKNTILFFGREKSELSIQATLKTPDGQTAESNVITLTVD
jgi:hypothetical protein